jgi:hypothetical protein
MADNIAITAGSGTTVKTDQLGTGEHVQYMKLMDGTLDSTTIVAATANGLKVDASGATIPVTDSGGSLTVDAPVGTPLFARLSDGTAALVGQKTSANSLPVTIASDQSAISVTPPSITKATQGSTGFTTQDLKDSGRVWVSITLTTNAPSTSDTLQNLVKNSDGTAAAGATTIAVTSGKRLRITAIHLATRATAASLPWAKAIIRCNPNGAVAIGSTAVMYITAGGTAAAIGNTASVTSNIPDGLEFSGTQQIGMSLSGNVATNVVDFMMVGYEY